jgi:restriction endonuclease Mrr
MIAAMFRIAFCKFFMIRTFEISKKRFKATRDGRRSIGTNIVLIDGELLVSLMVDNNVAVTPIGMYELKKIDVDYFEG